MAALPPVPATLAGLVDAEVTDSRWTGPRSIRQLAYALRRGTIGGAEDVAIATAKLLEPVAANAQFESLEDLVSTIRAVGAYLQPLRPFEQSVGNVIRRALHQLREDAIEEGIISQRNVRDGTASTSAVASPPSSTPMSPTPSYFSGAQKAGSSSRPSLGHFRPGSTFSISDLVAAGANTNPSSPIASTATTPGLSQSHTRQSSAGALANSIGQLSLSSVKEQEQADTIGDEDDSDGEVEGSISQLSAILVGVAEKIIEDIRMAPQEIASKCAASHIHSGEVIMTIGHDKTVEQFLKTAARHRQFTVVIGESAPDFSGHKLAKSLSAAKVQTILVPDSNIVALLPRVSKVIVGAQLILADGGLLVEPASRLLADMARLQHKPTLVLSGTYKLCPDPAWTSAGTWLHSTGKGVSASAPRPPASNKTDPSLASRALEGPPEMVLAATSIPGERASRGVASAEANRIVAYPSTEYLGPDGYDLLITNTGEHAVSLVHLLVAQNYDRQDLVL